MPTPSKGETRDEFVSRCIPIVMHENTEMDNKQAAAICFSIWRKKHGGEPPAKSAVEDELQEFMLKRAMG